MIDNEGDTSVIELIKDMGVQLESVKKQNVSLMKAYSETVTINEFKEYKEVIDSKLKEINTTAKGIDEKIVSILIVNQHVIDRLDKKKEELAEDSKDLDSIHDTLDTKASIADVVALGKEIGVLTASVESLKWPSRITLILLAFILTIVGFLIQKGI